jgi:hypothetical protein
LYLDFKRYDPLQLARPKLSPPTPGLLPEDTPGSDQYTDAPLAIAISTKVARRAQPFSQPVSYSHPGRPPASPTYRETASPTVVGTAGLSVLAGKAQLPAVPHTSKPLRKRWSPWSSNDDAEMVRLYKAKVSWEKIAAGFGRKPKSCIDRFYRCLGKYKKKKSWLPNEDNLLSELWAKGWM